MFHSNMKLHTASEAGEAVLHAGKGHWWMIESHTVPGHLIAPFQQEPKADHNEALNCTRRHSSFRINQDRDVLLEEQKHAVLSQFRCSGDWKESRQAPRFYDKPLASYQSGDTSRINRRDLELLC